MPQANDQEVDLIELRKDLIDALETLAPEHPRATAEMLQKFIEMRSGKNNSLSQIGNNLRILKKKGILEDVRVKGHRYWSLTGKKYAEDEIVRVLVAFPKAMHDRIIEFTKLGQGRQKLSKTAFIVNMVGVGLRSLEPLKREMDFPLTAPQQVQQAE